MPSRLYFSNSLDILVDRLIQGLDGTDPFDAPAIATPTPALRGWLQIRMAERLGIAANIDFLHLEKLLWNRLAELDHFRDAPDRQPARLLDAMNFQGLILTRLRTNPPLALQQYLKPDDGEEPYDEARRLCQLAGRLAALFREYEYSRVSEGGFRGLTETWNRGETCFEQYLRGPKFSTSQREQVRKLEEWQREIYQALFCEKGLRDRWGETTGVYRYTLPQYAEMVLSQKRSPISSPPSGGTEGTKTFHLFGLSHISPFHRALIYRLANAEILGMDAAQFEIYALNPCAEYWEDAFTSRERLTRDELQAEELPGNPGENALLNRFGKPGRETIKLWNQITDYDFLGDFQEPENDTLLAAVQRAVLHRSGSLEVRKAQDDSLQIWSAPDRHVEVEAAKKHIAELLIAEPSLKLEDIAVIPADFEAYLPVIEALFDGGKKAGAIPYCLPEAGLLLESDLLRGFRDLLELGAGPFRRNALLTWLENPAVQKKLRLNPALIYSFGKFLEESGFQEGWDEEHRQFQGAVPGSLSTAEAAMQRALLGFILDDSDPGLETAGLHPATSAIAGWDREEASRCLKVLDDLRRDLAPFRSNAKLSLEEWGVCLRGLIESYFKADPEQALELQAEKDLRRFCADLEQWSSLEEGGEGFSHHTLSVLIEDHFREPRAARMPFLAGGVRIGSLSALRSLPFRHVYMLGFNAGDFPSLREASPLDLRGYRRVIGEADPSSRDLYAFLETVCATSDRLIFSYVRRDAAKDSVRQPSHALAGLMTYLESDVLVQNEEMSLTFAVTEINATETKRLLKSKTSPPVFPAWAALPAEEKPIFDLRLVASYLKNPVEHACFDHFRLHASLEVEENDEAPPLFFDKRETRKLLNPALRNEWIHSGEGETTVRHSLQKQIWSGKAPSQPYASLEIERVEKEARDLIENSIQDLREAADGLGLRFVGTLRVGGQNGQGNRLLEPPFLDQPAFDAARIGLSANIGGTLPAFFSGRDPDNGWGLLLGSWDQEILEAYVFHLCVGALGMEGCFKGPGYLLFSENAEVFRLPPLDPETAAANLRSLLDDFQSVPDFDHLPLEVIEKITGKSDPDATRTEFDWKRKIEEREREEEESSFTPLKRRQRILRAIGLEVPLDARAKIHRRILPFLDWRNHWDEIES